jgi:hypothetical protein
MKMLILKNFTFELRGWDVEKFKSIDPTDSFGYNTRSYSYSRQAYANQSDCGMMMHMTSAKSTGGLLNGIISVGSNMISENPITFGVVGVALGGYCIYNYLLKNKNIDPKDSLDSSLLKNNSTDSLNNTELLSTENLEITTKAFVESSSSSFPDYLLGNNFNNFNTEFLSSLLVNYKHYDCIMDYPITTIPSVCTPVFVYGGFHLATCYLSPAIVSVVMTPDADYIMAPDRSQKRLLNYLITREKTKNAAILASSKNKGYGLTRSTTLPLAVFLPLYPASLLSVPRDLLTPLNTLSTENYHSKWIDNLKKSISYWCSTFPEVEAHPPMTIFLSSLTSLNNIHNIQTLNPTTIDIDDTLIQSSDAKDTSFLVTYIWLLALEPLEIDPKYLNPEILSWNIAATNAIRDYNLLVKALKGSAVAGEFGDLDIAINELTLSKKFLARAIAEFKSNIPSESSFSTREQYRFIRHCLDTNNEYLLHLFFTNFYEEPDMSIYNKMMPYVGTTEIGEQLLRNSVYNTNETVTLTSSYNLFPKEPSILVIAADENQLLEELD